MARSVEDAALLYQAMQGPDAFDPRTRGITPSDPLPTLRRGVGGLRPGRLPEADPLTRAWYQPFFTRWADRFVSFRWLQQGVLHAYLFYILAIAMAALAWVSLRDWLAP